MKNLPNDTPSHCRTCDQFERCAPDAGENLRWTSEHCNYGPSGSEGKLHNPQIEPLLQISLRGSHFSNGVGQSLHGVGFSFLITTDARRANNAFREIMHNADFCLKITTTAPDIVMEINKINHNTNLQIVLQR